MSHKWQVDGEPYGKPPYLQIYFLEGDLSAVMRCTLAEARELSHAIRDEVEYIEKLRAAKTRAEQVEMIAKRYPQLNVRQAAAAMKKKAKKRA